MRENECMIKELERYIKKGKKYFIYGLSNLGYYCFEKIGKACGEDCILGFIETKPQAEEYEKKRIYDVSDPAIQNIDADILLCSEAYVKNMFDSLLQQGIHRDRIVEMKDVYPYFRTMHLNYPSHATKVCFWPPLSDSQEIMVKKISWFLPDMITVILACDSDYAYHFNENVIQVTEDVLRTEMSTSDIIYIWNVSEAGEIMQNYSDKAYIVDTSFWRYVETLNYRYIYYNSHEKVEKERMLQVAMNRYEQLCDYIDIKKIKRGNIFCSGPSISEIYDAEFEGACNVVCNSMVKDKELMKRIKPKIIMFDDVNFYVSPTEYCYRFYEDVKEVVALYGSYIVVAIDEVPLISKYFPQLEEHVIGIPKTASTITFPSLRNFEVKATGSILTNYLLPIVSSLCEEIGIAGCTGRSEDETYFWQHSERTQYHDLMQSVFDMYPSFFRDQAYGEFYQLYCDVTRKTIEYGESLGKRYINLTTSFIPALKERTIKNGETT